MTKGGDNMEKKKENKKKKTGLLVIQRYVKTKDGRITIRLDDETSDILEGKANASEFIREAIKEKQKREMKTLTEETYFTARELEIYEELATYVAMVFGVGATTEEDFIKKHLPKLLPNPPTDMLGIIGYNLEYHKKDELLWRKFAEDNDAWLEFYRKAITFCLYKMDIPTDWSIPKELKELIDKYIFSRLEE